jgi:hypothetical protein
MMAEATVNPRAKEESSKMSFRRSVVPEMTAVSKPNKKPPRAAINAEENRTFFFISGIEKMHPNNTKSTGNKKGQPFT